jgi:hypothetical protein
MCDRCVLNTIRGTDGISGALLLGGRNKGERVEGEEREERKEEVLRHTSTHLFIHTSIYPP